MHLVLITTVQELRIFMKANNSSINKGRLFGGCSEYSYNSVIYYVVSHLSQAYLSVSIALPLLSFYYCANATNTLHLCLNCT